MPDWKRVNIDFPTIKLGRYVEPIKETFKDRRSEDFGTVYGVTNINGIIVTGKKASEDISKYTIIDKDHFVYNPYRINVGSIGYNSTGAKGCVSPAYVVFRTKPGLSPAFLYQYLKSEFGNHLINWYGNHGGVRNSLKYRDLCQIDIPDINYDKQLKITERIDNLKSLINDLAKELDIQSDYNARLRQRLLQEAIEGKLTAKWRTSHHEIINGEHHPSTLLERIRAEKVRLINEGKLRKVQAINNSKTIRALNIPDNWVWTKGDAIFFVTKLAGFEYTDYFHLRDVGEVPIIRAQNVRPVKISKDSVLFIDSEISKLLARSALTKPCLLVTFIGAGIGDVSLFEENTRWHLGPNVAKMEPYTNKTSLNLKYFNYYLLSKSGRKELFKHVKATAQPSLSMGTIRDIDYPVPSLQEQNIIVEKIDRLMEMMDTSEKQISERKEQLEMLMQSILREAFADGI